MFGIFSSKKLFKAECPMCTAEFDFKVDPNDFKFPDLDMAERNMVEVTKQNCPFCKIEITVMLEKIHYKNPTYKACAIDEKWENIEADHDDKIEPIYDKISEIEAKIDGSDEVAPNENIDALKKELDKLKAKENKLEEAFEKKSYRYSDRQDSWQEKYEKKYGSRRR